jgi:hypothetical protein
MGLAARPHFDPPTPLSRLADTPSWPAAISKVNRKHVEPLEPLGLVLR